MLEAAVNDLLHQLRWRGPGKSGLREMCDIDTWKTLAQFVCQALQQLVGTAL